MIALTLTLNACGGPEKPKASVYELSNLDTTINPRADFYQFVSGGWQKNNPLPAEYSRFGSFDKLALDNQKQLRGLIEELASTPQEKGSVGDKIGLYYRMGMDTAAIDAQGIKPIEEAMKAIAGIQDKTGLEAQIAEMHHNTINPFFTVASEADLKNSEQCILWLYQAGLGLPDRDYYFAEDAQSDSLRKQYLQLIGTLFRLSGTPEAETAAKAAKVMEVETRIAKASFDKIMLRDMGKNYNLYTLASLEKDLAGFNWKAYFESVGAANPGDINVAQLSYMKEIVKMLSDTPLEDLKTYMTWQLLNTAAPYLTTEFREADFAFYGKALSGKEKQDPRWKQVVNTVDGSLGEAVGQMYVAKYFPPRAKERMDTLVNNLQIALGERIRNLGWMSDSTKQKALEKLSTFRVKIGYPDKWKDYSTLDIKEDSYFANVLRSSRFEFDDQISKAGKPLDRDKWQMTPQTVNAYYNPTTNEICFPAGILQTPFFYMDGDDAINYGAIGVVIGHEMTHGFDDEGRKFDKNGNLSEWWLPEDATKFEERTKVLVDHFNNITVLDTLKANGVFTLGENIADNGGLQVAFQAFKNQQAVKAQEPLIDGYTPEQRFFISYATVWAGNIRDQEIIRRTQIDPHSLGKWRVNGTLPHIQAFIDAFDIKEGDPMYLAPEKRASIW
jgi:putative endopeptidase